MTTGRINQVTSAGTDSNRTLEYHSKYLSSSRPNKKTFSGHDVYAMWLSNPDVPPYFYTLHSAHYLVEWIVSCPRVNSPAHWVRYSPARVQVRSIRVPVTQ